MKPNPFLTNCKTVCSKIAKKKSHKGPPECHIIQERIQLLHTLKESESFRFLVLDSGLCSCLISAFLLCSHTRPRSSLSIKAGVNVKAVFTSLNTAFLPISRSRFKRRQIPMLKTLSTIWQFCVNFWVIFRCFGKERFFLKG